MNPVFKFLIAGCVVLLCHLSTGTSLQADDKNVDLQETRKTTGAPDNSYKVTTRGTRQSVKCYSVVDPCSTVFSLISQFEDSL